MNEVWWIGDVKITRVVEMEVTGGTRFLLPDATRDACLPYQWLCPNFMDDKGNLVMSIHALVVDTGSRTILVDTCIGNDKVRSIPTWSNLQTNFLRDLEGCGYPPAVIDTVLCTHLHVDHVGWNTRLVNGEWIPTFTQAEYLIARREWEYWSADEQKDSYGDILEDSVRPVIESGLAKFIDEDHQLCTEVCLKPTPGHTPAHVSVHIQSRDEKAMITGDCIHHPVQMTRSDWCSSADYDRNQARETRDSLLSELADSDVLVIGTHFATPTAGRVRRRAEGGYWLDVDSL